MNLFNTTDLFEEKAMFLVPLPPLEWTLLPPRTHPLLPQVINSIIVLANNVKSKPWYTGPIIADTSKVHPPPHMRGPPHMCDSH